MHRLEKSPSGMARLPWERIAIWLAIAAACAWCVGFAAGAIVKWAR